MAVNNDNNDCKKKIETRLLLRYISSSSKVIDK